MFVKTTILISLVSVAAAQWTSFPTADVGSESPDASPGPTGPSQYSDGPTWLPSVPSDTSGGPSQYSDGPTWLPSVPSDTSGGPLQYSDGPTWIPSVPSDTSGGPQQYSDGPTWLPSVPSDTSGGPQQYSDGPTWLPSVPSDTSGGPSQYSDGPTWVPSVPPYTSGAPSQYSDGPTWVPSVPSDTSGVPPSRSPIGPSHSPDGPSECDLCEHIIAQARYYFNNNITNEQDLQRQLIKECENLPPQEGPSAENTCKNMVNSNIDKIFSDIKAGDRDSQTCYDIGACARAPTFQTRAFHTRPPKALRAHRR